MSVHLHRTRQWTAWILIAAALSLFALYFASAESEGVHLSPVTGRVTIAGQPASDMIICLDSGDVHGPFGLLRGDGSFQLSTIRWIDCGAEPGRYHAHLYSPAGGPEVPARYRDPKTAGIVIDVASDWNDFRIDLP
jgi:hypothetical protein